MTMTLADLQSYSGDVTTIAPYQVTPIQSFDFLSKGIGSEMNTFANVFIRGAHVDTTSSAPAVAMFGQGVASATGAMAWGGNFVGYSNASGATGIGIEINYGNLVSGGQAYGIVIASAGNYAPQAAVQIQSNNAASVPAVAIRFNYGGYQVASGNLIDTQGAVVAQKGIDFSSASFTGAELDFPSFAVAGSIASTTGRILITASASATPVIRVTGTATDINIAIQPKGAGFVSLANAFKHTGSTFGALNATPAARTTGFGTPSGASIINNFNGSTATLDQTRKAVAQLISDLKKFGFYGA